MGTIYTQFNSSVMETLIWKNWSIFLLCMWICGGFAPCGPSELLATKKSSFGKKICCLAILLIMGQEIAEYFLFYFYGQKVVFWVKKRCFGVSWTKCEVADLKHRQGITTIDHMTRSNRVYYPHMALETPPTALLNVAPVPVIMAVRAIQHRLSEGRVVL